MTTQDMGPVWYIVVLLFCWTHARGLTCCPSFKITEAMFNVQPDMPDSAIEILGSKSTNKGCQQQEDGDTLMMTTNITAPFGG